MSKAIDLENGLPAIKTWVEGTFVAQESGKGLSSNDYTTTEKNKLAGIAAGAEVNVNADWNAASGDAKILNKPTIPTKTSDLTNDSNFATTSYVDGKVSGVYTYKGSVSTYANLPVSPASGDVYNVEAAYGDYPAGTNYAWTGSAWDALGGSFSITFATAAEVTEVLES